MMFDALVKGLLLFLTSDTVCFTGKIRYLWTGTMENIFFFHMQRSKFQLYMIIYLLLAHDEGMLILRFLNFFSLLVLERANHSFCLI